MCIDGDIFKGTFKNNKKTGCGTNKKTDGTIQKGHWRENKKQGLFQTTYSNGTKFCVNYVDDKKDGEPHEGKCNRPNNCIE